MDPSDLRWHHPNAPPPFKIDRIAVLAAPNGLNQVVLTVTGEILAQDDEGRELVVPLCSLLGLRPTDWAVVRAGCKWGESPGFRPMPPEHLPGNVVDLARSRAIEAMGLRLPELPS